MSKEDLVRKLPNDIGGESAGPIDRRDRELEPWEKNCHALADVLDFHKIINTEEKRRGVEALGAEMIANLSYYERWVIAFANIAFEKRILAPSELAEKMDELRLAGPADRQAPEYVLGRIGLNNHPPAKVQMLVNAIDLATNPQQAVDAPRFRVVMTNDQVQPDWTTVSTASHADGDTLQGMRRGILTAMAVASPVAPRLTAVALLSLTFATGLVDAISVLVLGHVFVANMTGNVIFLGFWFAPHSGVDLTAAAVAFGSFLIGTIIGGRFARHLDHDIRRWLTVALGAEVAALLVLAGLAGTGVLGYHGAGRLVLIVGLAMVFGAQSVFARQFGIQELSTTVLTGTIVSIGSNSRLAGGTGEGEKLRFTVVFTMCAGAVLGATLSRFVVAPVIALAAVSVATGLAIFRFGSPERRGGSGQADNRGV